MKAIQFQQKSSEQVYTDYIKRIRRMTAKLPKEDSQDILMEFNSHIYESMQRNESLPEIDRLLNALKKLGDPEEVLTPLIAEKTLYQATKTFNPLTVLKAIVLNIGNGISFVFFAMLYLLLFVFVFVIFAKLAWPSQVGLYFQDGSFALLGMMSPEARGNFTEVLGNWFIPVMMILATAFYFLITLLLRLKRKTVELIL